jgi:hypothetical protein
VDEVAVAAAGVIVAFAVVLALAARTPKEGARTTAPTPRRAVWLPPLPPPPAEPPPPAPVVGAPPRAQVVEGGESPRAPGERLDQAARSAGTVVTAVGTLALVGVLAIAATVVFFLVVLYFVLGGTKGWG